jgi:hypothetical protein
LGLLLSAGGVLAVGSTWASATTTSSGIIFGKVLECGPGPVVVAPGQPAPTPAPEMVVLVHGNRTYMSQSIHFSKQSPWIGAFSFTVPSGTYEVISSYEGYVRWVTVTPGSRHTVGFGLVACPD